MAGGWMRTAAGRSRPTPGGSPAGACGRCGRWGRWHWPGPCARSGCAGRVALDRDQPLRRGGGARRVGTGRGPPHALIMEPPPRGGGGAGGGRWRGVFVDNGAPAGGVGRGHDDLRRGHRCFGARLKMADSFSYEQLIGSGEGRLFGADSGRLPLPPMLMFDRITHIDSDGGVHGLGKIRAELDLRPDLWFFACHFQGDPVMPGCLGLDAMWQLIGFYLTWLQLPGRGRALGAGEVKFTGEVGPGVQLLSYDIDIKRVIRRKLVMAIGDARLLADGKEIYLASDLRVGLFKHGSDGAAQGAAA